MTGWRDSAWAASATAGLAYFITAAAAVAATRFQGGVACLWVAGAVLTAALLTSPKERWPVLLAACGLASALATALFGIGPMGAVPLAAANLIEGIVAAALIERLQLARDPLDSVGRLVALVLAIGVLAPGVTAPLGAGVVAWVTGTPFASNLLNWYAGHALGNVTAAPVFTLLAGGALGRWAREAGRARQAEAATLLLLVLATSVLVFAQERLPLLFLPILPVILATFRIGRLGAAISVIIVALVGGWYTARGSGPVNLIRADAVTRAQFFQLYLAATVLTALPVAAELRRRRQLFERLRESEARYRLLADHSTDIVMSLRADGAIRYASPSIATLGGYAPEAIEGLNAADLVLPEFREAVTRAHLDALADPDRTVIVEYQARIATGEVRWFETHTRGVPDDRGKVSGAVSAIRDISHRKAIEGELSRAAATDPLTGLANRRAFNAALDRMLGEERGGCVAVLDLDFFKRVNDRHGHEAGDRVLVAVADIARGAVRGGDLVARLGGEEFGVLLPGSDCQSARAVCERIREAIGRARLPAGDGFVRVTASAGLAHAGPGATRAGLLRAADEALYRAKADGRDRIRLAA